jgi:predicted aspartyl protease
MTWINYSPYANDVFPGLFVYADVYFLGSFKSTRVLMKIDTGSSLTTIPIHILKNELGLLTKIKEIECTAYNGQKYRHPVYVVDLEIEGNTFSQREIIGVENKDYGLLGRDILSHYFLRCDGRAQRFELIPNLILLFGNQSKRADLLASEIHGNRFFLDGYVSSLCFQMSEGFCLLKGKWFELNLGCLWIVG